MARSIDQIKKAVAKAPEGRNKTDVAERHDIRQEAVKDLLDKGYKYNQIAETLGLGLVTVQVYVYKIEEEPVEATAKNVVRLRDKEAKSWGRIAAATGWSETKVKAVYSDETGKSHREADIGRGGRPPKAATKPAPRKKAPAKSTKKAASSKSKSTKGKGTTTKKSTTKAKAKTTKSKAKAKA